MTSPASLPWGNLGALLLLPGMLAACNVKENYLGYDEISSITLPQDASTGTSDSGVSSPAVSGGAEPSTSVEVEAGAPAVTPPEGAQGGLDGGVGPSVPPEAGTESPGLLPVPPGPSAFEEVLEVSPEDIAVRVTAAYEQLFHGDSENETIYYEVGDDQAYIFDVLHGDTRLDALGYGMMITVQLDKQEEFDRLWRFTKQAFEWQEGAYAGYYYATCSTSGDECGEEVGVIGAFYVATALLFAEARWGNGVDVLDYGARARDMLDVMSNKETLSGGVVEGVTNLFDADALLPKRAPTEDAFDQVSPGMIVPAFFEVWGQATGEPFWTQVAVQSREFLYTVAHPDTGLFPVRANYDGVPTEGQETFNETSYGAGLALALDFTWYAADERQVELANRLVSFFAHYPSRPYPAIYSTAGEPLNQNPSGALIALNGATASIADVPERADFIRRVWDTPMPTGVFRFFDGINQMHALLLLGGYYRVH